MLDLIAENLDDVEAHICTGWAGSSLTNRYRRSSRRGGQHESHATGTPAARTLVLKQSVPFVAKYPSIPAPAERIAVEAAFYRATTQPSALAMRLPEVRGYDPDNRLMALEDLGASSDFTDIYADRDHGTNRRDITAGHTTSLLYWIGMLHGLARRPQLDFRSWRTGRCAR